MGEDVNSETYDGLIASLFLWIITGAAGAFFVRATYGPIPIWLWILLILCGVFSFVGGASFMVVVKGWHLMLWVVTHWADKV